MPIKKLFTTAVVTALFALSTAAFADGGWTCDVPNDHTQNYPGIQYPPGTINTAWKNCYLDSGVANCQAGKVIVRIACSQESIGKNLKKGYKMNMQKSSCHTMAKKGFLPAGTTEQDCIRDWTCFVLGHC